MVKKNGSVPATKADVDGLARRLDGHDERFVGIDARFAKVDARFDAVDARFDKIDGVLRTHALEFVKLRAEMSAVEARTAEVLRRLEDRFVSTLDRAVGRMESLWQESMLRPKAIDRHGEALGDHERRISALESRPTR